MIASFLVPIVIVAASELLFVFLRRQPSIRSSLHRYYLLQLAQLVVFLLGAMYIVGKIYPTLDVKSILLRGSALVVAILGFAAQPVISDLICGLLISVNKPFQIGDRILIEGQEPGIVESITLRHTVIRIYDGLRVIVPNSQMNSKIVTNTSYRMKDRRGIHMQFAVSYDTDVQKAMDLIRDCVEDSPYTLSIETDGIHEDSGPVYFRKFADSALILETTIWVSRETSNDKAVTDVNTRVLQMFREHGIEIPYPYINVVGFEGAPKSSSSDDSPHTKAALVKRLLRTNTIRMAPGEDRLDDAIHTAQSFAARQNLNVYASTQIELLTEEAIGFIHRLMERTWRDFWIEGTAAEYRIHIRIAAQVGSDEYKKLIEISSSGRNEAVNSLSGMIWEAVFIGLRHPQGEEKNGRRDYEWHLNESGLSQEEIGKSILGAVASDVRVRVTSDRVELIVFKNTV